MKTRHRPLLLALAAGLALAPALLRAQAASTGAGQGFPEKPITFVVPFAAGSAMRPSGRSGPGSTSSMSMPGTTTCRSSFCRAAPTSGAMPMAAAWKTGCGFCVR